MALAEANRFGNVSVRIGARGNVNREDAQRHDDGDRDGDEQRALGDPASSLCHNRSIFTDFVHVGRACAISAARRIQLLSHRP
jgi:hypothetical protein